MALPITILPRVTTDNQVNGGGSAFDQVTGARQVKPYDYPSPYKRTRIMVERHMVLGRYTTANMQARASSDKAAPVGMGPSSRDLFSGDMDWARNKARSKLLGYLGEQSMWFVNWKEREQAISSIALRAGQLYRSVRALKNGRPGEFLEQLYQDRSHLHKEGPRRRWHHPKHWSDTFLEYHFGWEPLVHDIYNAVDLLQGPVPYQQIEGKGSSPINKTFINSVGTADKIVQTGEFKGRAKVVCGCFATVDNPNLYLATQLGLVNPAGIAWELVPFSFVVDWFVNVGDFLNQWSDLFGLSISRPYTTEILALQAHHSTYEFYPNPALWGAWEAWSKGLWSDRTTSLPSVTLGIRPAKRLSVVRAATAIALLVQQGFKRF